MAQIDFYADNIKLNPGSGLGFFGLIFGQSIPVGEYNSTTYITNGNGTVQGAQVDNVKYINPQSGIVNSAGSGIPLRSMANNDAINMRFTHSSPVKTQNVRLYIYDRTNINNPPSGVTAKVAEIIHPNPSHGDPNGSGDSSWLTPAGSSYLQLAPSPGPSGLWAGNGTNGGAVDVIHDNYFVISASPDSIGSKTMFGLFCSLEYI